MFVSVMIGATAAVFGVGQTPVVAPVVVAPIQAPVPEQCGTQAELGIIVQGGKAPETGIIVQGGKTPETGIIVQGGKTAATGIIVQGGLETSSVDSSSPIVAETTMCGKTPSAGGWTWPAAPSRTAIRLDMSARTMDRASRPPEGMT